MQKENEVEDTNFYSKMVHGTKMKHETEQKENECDEQKERECDEQKQGNKTDWTH